MVYDTRLTLGYIFFELSSYRRAMAQFLKISTDFYDYPDVLLAMAWSSFKLGDYDKAVNDLNRLEALYPDYYNLSEVHFLRGQAFQKMGYLDFAIADYNKIIENSPPAADLGRLIDKTKAQLEAEQERIEDLRSEFLMLESQLLRLIPLPGDGVATRADPKNMQQSQESVVELMLTEQEDFSRLDAQIAKLKREIERTERLRNWRDYAEYGKARALYLKNLAIK